jgi:hypothetical protein
MIVLYYYLLSEQTEADFLFFPRSHAMLANRPNVNLPVITAGVGFVWGPSFCGVSYHFPVLHLFLSLAGIYGVVEIIMVMHFSSQGNDLYILD